MFNSVLCGCFACVPVPERVVGPPEVELQMAVRCPRVLEIEPGPLEGQPVPEASISSDPLSFLHSLSFSVSGKQVPPGTFLPF